MNPILATPNLNSEPASKIFDEKVETSTLRIYPSERIGGEIEVTGDKSISHRAVILAALADGTTRLTNFLSGEDCLCTLRALQALGCLIETFGEKTVLVHGTAKNLRAACEPLDCGNSGTSMRLLAGVLAGQTFSSHLFGDRSLSNRPMKRIIDPLTQMGAKIIAEGNGEKPPLKIEGSPLTGIDYTLPVASAQLKSSLLLAGLFAEGSTSVTENVATRDHTERLFEHFHIPLVRDGKTIQVRGGSMPHGSDFYIPGDFSSAAYWIVAAAAAPGNDLIIRNVGLNPTRTGLLSILLRMGGHIHETIEDNTAEPYGILRVMGRRLKGTRIEGDEIANVIDELPILAVAGALAHGETIIADAEELRLKESDRIHIMAENMRAFGVSVHERGDGMIIFGGSPLKGARVKSYGDHRIAMACAILGLFAEGTTTIEDIDCISTSYPHFTSDLKKLTDQRFQFFPKRSKNLSK